MRVLRRAGSERTGFNRIWVPRGGVESDRRAWNRRFQEADEAVEGGRMGSGARLLAGAGWTYGAQLTIAILQFAYAAVTSRLLDSAAFGAYAVALSITSLITVLATGGLGQAVGRIDELIPTRTRALATYALLLGLAGSVFTLASAPAWTLLWAAPGALGTVQLFALGALAAPTLGLIQGLCQRLGKFRQLALINLLSSVCGMMLGLVSVRLWPAPEALAVFPLVSQFLTLGVGWVIVRKDVPGFGRLSDARADVAFSWRIMLASVMAYFVGNLPRIGATQILGVSVLGQWNRAEVLSSVPFQQVQAALISTVYPEFRHDLRDPARARRVWADLLLLVAWFALPAAAAAAVITPLLLPYIFGPGWEIAAGLAPALCVAGGLQIVSTLLASAVESLGRFKWVWFTQSTLIVFQVLVIVLLFLNPTVWVLAFALVATNILRHALHVTFCVRAGYLRAGYLLRGYLTILSTSVLVAALAALFLLCVERAIAQSPAWWLLFGVLLAATSTALYRFWRVLPPVKIARRYGILP